ncbi:MAG: PIN domain-containing protein [Gemmatimonadota bacterium]
MIYLDSSILIELYLDGARAKEARAILDEPEPKISSFLMAVEVPIVLRRALHEPMQGRVRDRCLARFDADLSDVSLVDSLTDVALRVRSDRRFAKCRALDAVHACTALLLREWTGHSVRFATFDDRLGELAGELGLD